MMKRFVIVIGVLCLLQTPALPLVSVATAAPKALAIQDHEVADVEVALLEVKRTSGNTVTVRWHYRNKSSRAVKLDHGGGSMDGYRFARAAYLLDAVNRVKYPVLMDSNSQPVAALHPQFGSGIVLTPRQTVVTWAKFQAPAAGVTNITVNVPGAPPFEDVPLS